MIYKIYFKSILILRHVWGAECRVTALRFYIYCMLHRSIPFLKVPGHEIFKHGVFSQIRPERVVYLGTRQKILYRNFDVAWYAKKIFLLHNKVVFGCFFNHFNGPINI